MPDPSPPFLHAAQVTAPALALSASDLQALGPRPAAWLLLALMCQPSSAMLLARRRQPSALHSPWRTALA
jgi:hypothetical protein